MFLNYRYKGQRIPLLKSSLNEGLFSQNGASLWTKQILEKYGRIDIIVNNAGANLNPEGGFSTLSDEHWINDWQLNFLSVVRINKALLPTMIEQKSGVIIKISTNAAKQPSCEMTLLYSSSKATLDPYSKALANELGAKGNRVSVVSPEKFLFNAYPFRNLKDLGRQDLGHKTAYYLKLPSFS